MSGTPRGTASGKDTLCVCLDSVFAAEPQNVLPRIAECGITRFEFWDWRQRDVDALMREATALGLSAVSFSGNTFAEVLVAAGQHEKTLAHIGRSLQLASRLGIPVLVIHVGYALPGRSRVEQWDAVVAGLRQAGAMAAASGVTLAVEALNSKHDHPEYFLDSLDEAQRLLGEVDHPSVRLLLDVYHMWVMHADLLKRLPVVLPVTAHVHLADVPGRVEPGSGTILWRTVIHALQDGGYQGAVGLEFWPTLAPDEALLRSMEVLAG